MKNQYKLRKIHVTGGRRVHVIHTLTFSPFSRISSALGPRTVQWTAIFSFLLMPKDRTVYLALENTGFCPVRLSSTCRGHAMTGIQQLTPMTATKVVTLGKLIFLLDSSSHTFRNPYLISIILYILYLTVQYRQLMIKANLV